MSRLNQLWRAVESLAHGRAGESDQNDEEDCALDPSVSPPRSSNTMALVTLQTEPNIKRKDNNDVPMSASAFIFPKRDSSAEPFCDKKMVPGMTTKKAKKSLLVDNNIINNKQCRVLPMIKEKKKISNNPSSKIAAAMQRNQCKESVAK
jgi:hypothetical protein